MTHEEEIDITGVYRYGSNDSDDVDIFIALSRVPDYTDDTDVYFIEEIHQAVSDLLKSGVIAESNRKIEYSLIHVSKDGAVDWCEYDDLEECNNALFHTFSHHAYNNSVMGGVNPVKKKLRQNVSYKIVKVVRSLLTYLSRTEHRTDVKYLLKNGTFGERLEFVLKFLSNQGLSELESFNKNLSDVEITKDIAFMFIQLYSLIHDVDVFTKRDAVLRYPDMMKYIYKESDASRSDLEVFMIETFEALSMNIEVYKQVDGIKYCKDQFGCLNKEEKIIDLSTKKLQ